MIGNNFGIQLHGNSQALTDLRFADDVLLFALSLQQILKTLRSLVSCVRQVGLVLHASKKVKDGLHAALLTNGWAVSCLWMVTKQQILNFISMQLHVHRCVVQVFRGLPGMRAPCGNQLIARLTHTTSSATVGFESSAGHADSNCVVPHARA